MPTNCLRCASASVEKVVMANGMGELQYVACAGRAVTLRQADWRRRVTPPEWCPEKREVTA